LGEGLFVGAGIVLSEKYLNGGNQIISQRDLWCMLDWILNELELNNDSIT